MKTAEEIIMHNIGSIYEVDTEQIADCMKEYARQAFKEQRDICFKNSYKHLDLYLDNAIGVLEEADDLIRNAPEPELK